MMEKNNKFATTYKCLFGLGSIFYFNTKNITNNYISNILACISVLSILNLDLSIVKSKFNDFKIPDGRGNIEVINKFKKFFNLIDESYNANPLSMKSAINNVNNHKKQKNAKKIIFLGDMLELGKKSKKLHRDLSPIINKSKLL